MKFWKTLKLTSGSLADRTFATLERTSSGNKHKNENGSKSSSNGASKSGNSSSNYVGRGKSSHGGATPSQSRRRSDNSCASFSSTATYEELIVTGTTFVELIKRHGTYLGVIVSGGSDTGIEPRISDLIPGSWAQRSDVLCIGDIILSVNNIPAVKLTQKELMRTLDESDRIQLEVQYRLPPLPLPHTRVRTKIIQVTLKKDNGSFGIVIRGGHHELGRKRRPFTVSCVTPNGPAFLDGTIRTNDRVIAINGTNLQNLKLPELQALIYKQDKETVFTLEYDVALHDRIEHGPILVEMRREASDILGFGLNKCTESGQIYIESIKQASLADRCGALHVGDIILAVNGKNVSRLGVDDATELIRGSSDTSSSSKQESGFPNIIQLEVLPGIFSRSYSNMIYRSSMPSPCFSTLSNRRHFRGAAGCAPGSATGTLSRKSSRYQSMQDIDRQSYFPPLPPPLQSANSNSNQYSHHQFHSQEHHNPIYQSRQEIKLGQNGPQNLGQNGSTNKERKKYVTFTVELQREGGPLGLTLATESDATSPGIIFISSLTENGLAERSKTIQINDQLVEVNGISIQGKCLNEVIPLLQNSNDTIRLKLARLISIPERDFSNTLRKSKSHSQNNYGMTPEPIYSARKPPLPSPSPCRSIQSSIASSSYSNYGQLNFSHQQQNEMAKSPTPTVTLLPLACRHASSPSPARSASSIPIPMEVHKVTLFKDNVYEDFGFRCDRRE